MSSSVCYFGTDNPLTIGDRILVHFRFSRAQLATVVYVPGQGKRDADLGDHEWVYQLVDGGTYVNPYDPAHRKHADKRILFVSRAGAEAQAAIAAHCLPAEDTSPTTGRDLLAFIGCGTIVALLIVACIALWMWLFP